MVGPLRLIDGGLNDPQLNLIEMAAADRTDTAVMLGELAKAVRPTAEIRIDHGKGAVRADSTVGCSRSAIRFSLHGRAQDRPLLWTSRVTSRRGIFRTLVRRLDVRFIALCAERADALRDALALGLANGRTTPCVVTESDRPDTAARTMSQVLGRDGEYESLTLAEAVSLFVRDSFVYDTVLASPQSAALLETLAAELTGTGPLRARCWRHADGISSGGMAAAETGASVGADISALTEAMAAAGWCRAAASLANALLKTLEDNLYTESMPTIMPYGRRLGDLAFIEAVGKRIGETPRHTAPVVFSANGALSEEQGRSSLSVVPPR